MSSESQQQPGVLENPPLSLDTYGDRPSIEVNFFREGNCYAHGLILLMTPFAPSSNTISRRRFTLRNRANVYGLSVVVVVLVLLSWLRGIGYPGEPAPGEMLGLWASWKELLVLYGLLAAGLVVAFRYQPEVHPWRFLGHWGLTGGVGFVIWVGLGLGGGMVGSMVMNRLLPGSEFYAILLSGVVMEAVFAAGSLSLVYLQLQGRLQFWVFGDYPVFSSLFRGGADFLRVFPWVVAAAVVNKYLFVWLDLSRDLPHSVQFFQRAESTLQHLSIVLLVLVIAPICEELLFRGVLYRLFRSWTPARLAAAGSGVLFALLHFDGLVVLPLVVFGYHLGRTYEQTGSIVVATAMHASQNAVSLVLMYLIL